ncbi:unnamed protein product, partial [Urochloa humidicola]
CSLSLSTPFPFLRCRSAGRIGQRNSRGSHAKEAPRCNHLALGCLPLSLRAEATPTSVSLTCSRCPAWLLRHRMDAVRASRRVRRGSLAARASHNPENPSSLGYKYRGRDFPPHPSFPCLRRHQKQGNRKRERREEEEGEKRSRGQGGRKTPMPAATSSSTGTSTTASASPRSRAVVPRSTTPAPSTPTSTTPRRRRG